MIRINLLPYRVARKKENIRFQVNVFFGSIILVGLIVMTVNMKLNGTIRHLNSEIASTRAQVAKYQEINKEIAEIKKTLELLEKKIEVIQSLERDRKAPVENMDALYRVLVEKRMWYTKIEENNKSFKVNGVALDNQTVADYMRMLEKSNRFSNVRLSTIKKYSLKDKESLSLKEFDINFQQMTKNAEEKK